MTRLSASPAMKQAMVENLAAGSADRLRSVMDRANHMKALRSQAERAIAVPFPANDDAVHFLRFAVMEASLRLSSLCHTGEVENLHEALARKRPAPVLDVVAIADAKWSKVASNDPKAPGEAA